MKTRDFDALSRNPARPRTPRRAREKTMGFTPALFGIAIAACVLGALALLFNAG